MITYAAARLAELCENARQHCAPHFATFTDMWKKSPWDLSKGEYFAEVSELHLLVQAFFSGVKSQLDLLVQLLSTEGIVGAAIDGFHRANNTYGGNVLNALANNVVRGKSSQADACAEIITRHKHDWIDQVIQTRDFFVHPEKGTYLSMFEIILSEKKGKLIYERVAIPRISQIPIHEYARAQVQNVQKLASSFLSVLAPNTGAA